MRVLWWGLTLLLCSLIFVAAGDPRFTGAETEALVGGLVSEEAARPVNVLLRKGGHVATYGLLALASWQALRGWPAPARPHRMAWLFTTAYALTDEVHQAFVPGRTGAIGDVVLDSLAAALALWLVTRLTRKAPG